MRTRELMVFMVLNLLAVVVVSGAVTAYQRSQSEVLVDTPVVRVESNKATVAHVEKDDQGTRIAAPGVEVEAPKSPWN